MSASTTAARKSDPWEMALIHRLIRRGFEQAREFVMAVPAGAADRAAAVAEYVEFQLDGLHAHHSSEDELAWPALRERASLSGALITRMEDQHARVDAAIERARELLGPWAAAPNAESSEALASAVGAVGDRLAEHLAEEERDVVPLIATHITQAEWEHLGKVSFSKFKPRQRFTAMGEMLEAASPEEVIRMLAGLPRRSGSSGGSSASGNTNGSWARSADSPRRMTLAVWDSPALPGSVPLHGEVLGVCS